MPSRMVHGITGAQVCQETPASVPYVKLTWMEGTEIVVRITCVQAEMIGGVGKGALDRFYDMAPQGKRAFDAE